MTDIKKVRKTLKLYKKQHKEDLRLPFIEFAKDLVDTLWHYKNWSAVLRDVALPFRAIGNLLSGAFNMLCGALSLFCTLFAALLSPKDMPLLFSSAISFLTMGLSLMCKGILQLVITIPTWLIKMPLRTFFTAIRDSYRPIITIEQIDKTNNKQKKITRKEIQTILEDAHNRENKYVASSLQPILEEREKEYESSTNTLIRLTKSA